ncbi:hypothetical protein [Methylobrevis pamukkalensis]|uniref:Uncharacterized protein n=1 Tax=Methylobrevis pamukkalensis TaxID=1439726 RepID=A0A1E3H4N4_9HYPH|nr:hypothetical protein [Methylobrevis pamukkalensis]ODN70736.1 hypothetical protein A6302_01957 [Methylobrevis pamukkalensis]
MTSRDPFVSSLMARSAAERLVGVAAILALLWLAVWWAVVLP